MRISDWSSDVCSSDLALRYGIVNKVVPDDQVEAAAYEWAAKIAEGAPLTARWHKQFIYRLMEPAPLTEAEKDMGYDAFDTEDFQRGYKIGRASCRERVCQYV